MVSQIKPLFQLCMRYIITDCREHWHVKINIVCLPSCIHASTFVVGDNCENTQNHANSSEKRSNYTDTTDLLVRKINLFNRDGNNLQNFFQISSFLKRSSMKKVICVNFHIVINVTWCPNCLPSSSSIVAEYWQLI